MPALEICLGHTGDCKILEGVEMGQLLKNLKVSYHFYAYRVLWMVIMIRKHIDMVLKSVSDYIVHYCTTTGFAILLISLWAIYFFEISLLQIIFISPFIFIILLYIYCYSGVTESVCIGGVPHTWIKDGEHGVSEPWSDKQFITYWVADFKCSVCGIKKEEEVEEDKQQGIWK